MKAYRYKAVMQDGKKIADTIEASDEYDAVARIRENRWIVTRIKEVGGKQEEKKPNGKVSEKSLAVLCSQFSIILGSGLPMVRALELIEGQTTDKVLKQILKQAVNDVAAGYSLAQSFRNFRENLPITMIETVRSGEESGTLEASFRRLHSYYSKSFHMKNKVKTAMIYPVFTLLVAMIVIVIIMVVAVPAFTQSFAAVGGELPWVTRVLIALSDFFIRYWIPFIILFALGVISYTWYGNTEKGKLLQAELRLKTPIFGKINRLKISGQFANTLSTLLMAGLPVLQAVSIAALILDNNWMGEKITSQLKGLEEGKTLSACLHLSEVLPSMLTEMIGIGEETGTLEPTLEVIGSYYDKETEFASQKALSYLEPIIICVLGGIVAFVLLSVYLPMISLYSNMN